MKIRNITLIYDATLPSDGKVIEGVAAYVREVGNWSVYIEEFALGKQHLPNLKTWHVDGILADFDDPKVSQDVQEMRIPVVGFGGGYGWYNPDSDIPYFYADNKKISRMSADHFLERGFRNFAYCGYPPTKINGWSFERGEAFQQYVGEAGFTCSMYKGHHKTAKNWGVMLESICNWLTSLPKPLGLMAANDKRARQVLEACKTLELRVPEQVAVLGVDNDEMLCQLATPALSSVKLGARQLGYQAASLLDKMISGKSISKYHYTIPPEGVVARASTDVLAIEDREMAEIVRYVHDHAFDGIKAQDVVDIAGISRPTLESRFEAILGHSIHTEIRNVQLKRAKELIQSSDLPLKSISRICGFKSIQYLTYFFRQATGQTPAEYRRSFRLQ
ncbi:MAG: DNA-binding transcriptional regulator [Pirellulales bacterium]|nr:DNA-binding transcriptional regulator [Pirellulales bacterium]